MNPVPLEVGPYHLWRVVERLRLPSVPTTNSFDELMDQAEVDLELVIEAEFAL